jgi:4-amino-4-deoxy-L-arabinose transferase-like glycosyltransferase
MFRGMTEESGARAAWRPALWVAGAAAAMAALDLGQRILATNDEARFALLAQDILTRGAWLFPRLNGVAYNAKPPLQAWLIALVSWPAGGVTQLTAVLPSALAAVATALAIFAAGRVMFGAAAGRLAALVAVTTQGWFLHARLPMPDMLVTFFVTAAVAMLWPMTRERPGRWWLGFYGAMAAAFWGKGAVALLPLAVAVAWGVASGRHRWWRLLHLPAGLALFAVLVAPWWIGKLLSEPAAMGEVIVSDNLLWYLPRSPAMLAGPPQHLVGILFPWVLASPLAVWQAVRAVRARAPERDALLFALVWSGALLLCLGISEQQRLRYYLPLVSPMALLIGWWGAGPLATRAASERMPWGVYAVVGAVLALSTGAAALFRHTWATAAHVAFPASALEVGVMAGGLLVMLAALAYGVRRGQLARAVVVAWIGSAVWVAGWYHWELGRRNAAYDYPGVGAQARRLLPEAPVVAAWGVYELPFSFYFGRRVVAVQTDGDLRRVMSEHPRASAVLTESSLRQVEDRGGLLVLPLDRLNFAPIVLVSAAAAPPPAGRRP